MLTKKRYFTLIEIILASVVLLIALLGSSAFYLANRRNLLRARMMRKATWTAIDAMERMKNAPYESIGDEADAIMEENQNIFIEIETESDGGPASYKRVTVAVSWNDSDVTFVTYMADY